MAQTYSCECIKCNYKMESEQHCADLKCPECGGQMRRAERPGPGQSKQEAKHKDLFRAGVARGIKDGKSGVDREKGVIYGFAVITKGTLKEGDIRDEEIDDLTLDQTVIQGNKTKLGTKSRYGHPNMSSTALGTYLGRAKNYRRDGDVVRADLHFDKTAYNTPEGDLATYVMDLAESDSGAFGASIHFLKKLETRLNEDGTAQRDEKTGERLPQLVRVEKLYAADIVDDPATRNKGMFGASFFSDSVKPSAEMTAFLDRLLTNPDALDTVISFLQRYTVNRGEDEAGSAAPVAADKKGNEVKTGLQTEKEEEDMDLKDITLDMLKADRPDLVETLSAKAKEEGKIEGEKLERKRVTDILDKAGEFESMEDLPLESIKAGDSLETADGKFKAKKIEQLEKSAPKTPGPSGDSEPPEDESQLSVKEKAEKEWEKDSKLRDEFSAKETYVAFKEAEAKGRVKIVSS